ncbi:5-formyltetrahydrofolate cyclo-ligase [Methanospirillum stamsii]|uniref:5-formyltetrahydrofolate cyclo-ligase n=1 Tax=Methanospirillum stamsii TaxID=1277351 RepID=A0A2V2NBH0_9EURY|nr:5-formyltetrahydrofolate cyclo-ligase [Methanospirillum stamsii]PWR74966.1 5-formyltetrahydrofolate cyclo-ligase [Methanospirillum stamsii]
MIQKEAIRSELRERRWSIPEEEREKMSRKICSSLSGVITPCESVLVYCAKIPEVETCWFIDNLLSQNRDVIVPIIEKETISLRLSYIKSRDVLLPGTFNVPEPIGNEIPASAKDITCAIIPMLGYDRTGGRIGYGAGYYDRFLSDNPYIKKIGIAYSAQEVPSIPVQPHDIRMDVIVTETSVIRCNGGQL